jgi:myo-inositol-1(or 4)-monophosphatase
MRNLTQKIKKEVVVLIKKTGQTLLKEFQKDQKIKTKLKNKHEIVTQADFLAEKIILKKLKQLTPNWQIISEETGNNNKKSNFLWLVDPLDGTTNFSMGNPLFAVQIALIYKNEPIWAYIYAPAINEFYYSEKNKGAFLNNKKIQVSNKKIAKAILTYCHGNQEKYIKQALKIYNYFKIKNFDIRQLGCAALEFAWVAKGKTECYITPGANPWDICSGILLVKEAGGTAYDFKGKPWQFSSKNVYVGNKIVDQSILKFLKTL